MVYLACVSVRFLDDLCLVSLQIFGDVTGAGDNADNDCLLMPVNKFTH